MIICNVDGYDYRISFHHDKPDITPRTTVCKLERVKAGSRFNDEGESISTGISTCAKVDNFSKAYGRFRSMKRAMKSINDKNLRKKIWGIVNKSSICKVT
ncbi:MAG: hypothetical protein GF364_00870 [Candidatus Lokiarchaeota archaeon]|nr:hypothetical protein [Candidatus Lokiarchaeota archaeon]